MPYRGFIKYNIVNAKADKLIRSSDSDFGIGGQNFLNLKIAVEPVTIFVVEYEVPVRKNISVLGSIRSEFSYFNPVTY